MLTQHCCAHRYVLTVYNWHDPAPLLYMDESTLSYVCTVHSSDTFVGLFYTTTLSVDIHSITKGLSKICRGHTHVVHGAYL